MRTIKRVKSTVPVSQLVGVDEMTNNVLKMVDGYAYASLRTLENVIVSPIDCERAKFMGLVENDDHRFARFRLDGRDYFQLCGYCRQLPQKAFTLADVIRTSNYPRISCDKSELLHAPTKWQEQGLQETATGYGKRLNSGLMIWFEGKYRRVYVTIYSNTGTSWFNYQGERIIVG